MAYRCGMQQVITFSALFNAHSYLGFGSFFRTLFNLKQLFREPRGYLEILLVTLSTGWCYHMLKSKVGLENLDDLVTEYGKLRHKPAVTLYYGQYAPPDAAQARLMTRYPEIKLVPVPTAGHNTPGFLYARGKLGSAIADEISAALAAEQEQPV